MNSTEKNTYSIAALAAELQVPRTTVNDWLSRYADFMDSELSGRRRLYTGRTLAVLREIAALRDRGGSGAEIAEMLAGRHGVRPDVAAGPAPERSGATSAPENPEEAPPRETDTSFPVALRRMDENFEAFGKWMLEQRTLQEAQKRRQRWTLVLVLALLAFVLAAAGAGAWLGYRYETRRRAEQEALNAALHHQRELAARLESKVSGLEAGAAEAARRAAAEKAELLERHQKSLTAMDSAWKAERAARDQRWSEELAKRSAEQRELVERLERSLRENGELLTRETERSRAEEQRLRSELEAARRALREAEEKLRSHEPASAAPAESAPAVSGTAGSGALTADGGKDATL